MTQPARPRKRPVDPEHRRQSQRATPGLLEQRSLALPAGPLPTVVLKSSSYHPFLYRRMIGQCDAAAQPGDLVAVIDKTGAMLGHGLYNPRSEITVRMLNYGPMPPDEAWWHAKLARAVELRRGLLQLDQATDAYRLVHAEGDGLTGLVVDRLGAVLSAEVFSLGIYQRAEALLAHLATLCGTQHTIIAVDAQVHGQEGFLTDALVSPGAPSQVTIVEHGTRFRVSFASGHKTGFFCDQRDNRRMLAGFCQGRSVLDLCSYTGGFAVQAKRLGGAAEVTGVDLDETAVAVAKENAALNQAKVQFVHADAFGYMRDMLQNGRQFDVVVLDPPKLIRSRRELEDGIRKHFDFNRLAMQLVKPGGLLFTCSCSGLLNEMEFMKLIYSAARQAGPRRPDAEEGDRRPNTFRNVQLLAKTGAAADHPVAGNCPESEYLRAAWLRLE